MDVRVKPDVAIETDCSEEFRARCEARWVLKKPIEARRAYLARIAQVRGQKAADYLAQMVRDEWERARST